MVKDIDMAVATPAATTRAARTGHYRWVVCGLLFFGTTVNHVDRQVLGILAPDLSSPSGLLPPSAWRSFLGECSQGRVGGAVDQ